MTSYSSCTSIERLKTSGPSSTTGYIEAIWYVTVEKRGFPVESVREKKKLARRTRCVAHNSTMDCDRRFPAPAEPKELVPVLVHSDPLHDSLEDCDSCVWVVFRRIEARGGIVECGRGSSVLKFSKW
jgi:hypothetical protein